jgi:hypothetical protein
MNEKEMETTGRQCGFPCKDQTQKCRRTCRRGENCGIAAHKNGDCKNHGDKGGSKNREKNSEYNKFFLKDFTQKFDSFSSDEKSKHTDLGHILDHLKKNYDNQGSFLENKDPKEVIINNYL